MLKSDPPPVRKRRTAHAFDLVIDLVSTLGPERIARELGVERSTIHRWLTRQSLPTPATITALRALTGRVPNMDRDPRWEGWYFAEDGRLYLRGLDRGWHAGDLLAFQYELAQLRYFRQENVKLKARLAQVEDQLAQVTPAAANERKYFG